MIERRYGEITTFDTRAEAHEQVDKVRRYGQIIECLKETPQMTAKQIAVRMYEKGYTLDTDRNNATPRLTEMSQSGLVEPIGKTKCEYTGKTVAVYGLCEER